MDNKCKIEIEKFDIPLIGIDIPSGYRIQVFNKNVFRDYINYLCDTFGEGYKSNISNAFIGLGWSLVESADKISVILESEDMLKKFCTNFGIIPTINYSNLIESKIERVIKPFLFRKINQRTKDQLREELRKEFNVKPFDISIDNVIRNISIKMGNKTIQFTIK